MAGRGAIKVKRPKIDAAPAGPRPRNQPAPLPLAGGGATGGKLYVDPKMARDAIEAGRAAGNAKTVGQDLAETISRVVNNPGGSAPAQQLIGNLHRTVMEDSRSPMDGSLEPYRAAFLHIINNDGGTGQGMATVKQFLDMAGLEPDVEARLLSDKPTTQPRPVAQTPAVMPTDRVPTPEDLGLRATEQLDMDRIIPAQEPQSPIPLPMHDLEAMERLGYGKGGANIHTIEDAGPVWNPNNPNATPAPVGTQWTQDQFDRGWRSIEYPPLAEPAPRRVGNSVNTQMAQTAIDREKARLDFAVFSAGGPNTEAGKAASAIRDNFDELVRVSRERVAGEMQAALAARQAEVDQATASKDPRRIQEATYRLGQQQAMADDYEMQFSAMAAPAPAGPVVAAPSAGPLAGTKRLEVLKHRIRDLLPQPGTPEMENPNFGQVTTVYSKPPQQTSPLANLRRDVEEVSTIAQKQAALNPDQQAALLEAQEYANALQAGREATSALEASPNSPDTVQPSSLLQDAGPFDDTAQGRALLRQLASIERRVPALQGLIDQPQLSLVSAGENPAAAATRGDFEYSLSSLLGGDLAEKMYYDNRPPGIERKLFPQIQNARAVEALADLTGRDYFPALPPESPTVGLLDRAPKPEEFSSAGPRSRVVFDEGDAVDGARKGRVVYQMSEDEAAKPEGSVSTPQNNWYYREGVGNDPNVAAALRIADQRARLNPKYDPANPDAVDAEGRPIPKWDIDPHFVETMKTLLTTEGTPQSGRIIQRRGTSGNMNASLERSIMGEGRSPLDKYRELVYKVLEGEYKDAPKALRGLIGEGRPARKRKLREGEVAPPDPLSMLTPEQRVAATENLRHLLEQGGILPLDDMAAYWRGIYEYTDPADGQKYFGHLSPEIVARFIAQQLVMDNPHDIARLIPVVERSMKAYDMIPASGKALEYFIEANGNPRVFLPASGKLDPSATIRLRTAAPTNSTSSIGPRFTQDQFQTSPVSMLIG